MTNDTQPKARQNSRNPIVDDDYKYFTESDKEEIRKAFQAGREYEASLFSDVLNTIVQQVKLYRQSSDI